MVRRNRGLFSFVAFAPLLAIVYIACEGRRAALPCFVSPRARLPSHYTSLKNISLNLVSYFLKPEPGAKDKPSSQVTSFRVDRTVPF